MAVLIVMQLDYPFGIFTLLPVESVSITNKVVNSNPAHGEVYSIQHYVIKSSSDLRQVGGTPVFSTNQTDRHDIAKILLKVALYTITLTHLKQR